MAPIDRSKRYENVTALKIARQQSKGFRGVLVRVGGQYTNISSFNAQRNATRGGS